MAVGDRRLAGSLADVAYVDGFPGSRAGPSGSAGKRGFLSLQLGSSLLSQRSGPRGRPLRSFRPGEILGSLGSRGRKHLGVLARISIIGRREELHLLVAFLTSPPQQSL